MALDKITPLNEFNYLPFNMDSINLHTRSLIDLISIFVSSKLTTNYFQNVALMGFMFNLSVE